MRSKLDLMTARDEELVKFAHAGDKEAEELLIQRYKGLALTKSRSYYLVGGDRDDLIQEGMIGIFQAIRDYDEAGGASFATFVNLCVGRQMMTAIRAANRKKHKILNDSLSLESESDGEGELLKESMPVAGTEDPAAVVATAEIAEILNDAADIFSPMEREVFGLLMEGRTNREIAGMLSCGTKSVNNAVQRIKKKIRQMVNG